MVDEPIRGDKPVAEQPKYDQDFFLALALKGKDVWNEWRRDPANKDLCVTFAGVDFSELPRDRIRFAGFAFGDDADFSGCKWRGVAWEETQKDTQVFAPGRAWFSGAAFGDRANFSGVVFGVGAHLVGATFGDMPNFSGAAFEGATAFTWAAFGSDSNFIGAVFGDMAIFTGAVFGDRADFTSAAFRRAGFSGAAFGERANFSQSHFKDYLEFTGRSEEQWTEDLEALSQMGEQDRAAAEKRHKDSWKRFDSGPDRFLTISFAHAQFDNEADFSDRTFARIADFTDAHVLYPPDFGGVTDAARIDFSGAHIDFAPRSKLLHWTQASRVPIIRVRAFRKIAEETKNHDLERDLYIEERKAERGAYLIQRWQELKNEGWKTWPRSSARLIAHCLWITVMGVYWALADYGRSFVRPFVALIANFLFFCWCYTKILAPLAPRVDPLADQYDHAIRMLALGNTVPFVGPLTIDSEIKKFLFCPLNNCPGPIIPPEGYQLAVLSQNLLSIVLVFFIGLALRNYFKIK